MNVIDCLQEPVFTNFRVRGKETLLQHLGAQFAAHFELVGKISEPHIVEDLKEHFEKGREASKNLTTAVLHSLLGDQYAAMQQFDLAMQFYLPFLIEDGNGGRSKETLKERSYYRARIGGTHQFTKEEMFHLPFSKRAFATTKRFSVPGLPCLYLSNSAYVCWEELGQPEFSKMQVSRFQQEDVDMKILDISHTPKQMEIQLRSFASSRFDKSLPYHDTTISMLVTWPLILACSLQKSVPGAVFHEEYIVPQLLMQWLIRNAYIHGIKYFSNCISAYNNQKDFSKFDNYVFPPRAALGSEFCERLCGSFSMTEPVSYERIMLTDPHEKIIRGKGDLANRDLQQLELISGKLMPYAETHFGKLEIFTRTMPTAKIQPD